jgi:hypothetical protein
VVGGADDELEQRRVRQRLEPLIAEVQEAIDAVGAGERLEPLELAAAEERRVVGVGLVVIGEAAVERRAHHHELLLGLEDDGVFVGRLGRGDLRALLDHLALGALDEVEGDERARRLRRAQADADHVEEGEVVLLRNAVEPVQDELGHPRRQLEHGDARVRRIVIGPVGAIARDEPHRLGDDIGIGPVVELRCGNHDSLRRI